MKAVVVGAGITGCVAALNLLKRGFNVAIYESSQSVGGILCDLRFDESPYFSSCQYLNSRALWFSELLQELDCELHEFEHTYSSYTTLFDEKTVHHDFAGPVIKRNILGFDNVRHTCESLKSRLLSYPPFVSSRLLNWLDGYGLNPDQLSQSCAIGIQMSRVYFDYNDADLARRKYESSFADDLLGVPRSIINPTAARQKAWLPVNGFDDFFTKLRNYLALKGADVYLNHAVTPRRQSSCDINISCRGQVLSSDLIVWCANPVPIINASGIGKLDNPSYSMNVLVCDIVGLSSPISPHYIQLYSEKSAITRIYVYSIGGRNKASIECFHNEALPHSIIADAKNILAECGFEFELLLKGTAPQKRHTFYTIGDSQKFEAFDEYSKTTNIVGGAWWEYGRDAKIKKIDEEISLKLG